MPFDSIIGSFLICFAKSPLLTPPTSASPLFDKLSKKLPSPILTTSSAYASHGFSKRVPQINSIRRRWQISYQSFLASSTPVMFDNLYGASCVKIGMDNTSSLRTDQFHS